MEYALSLVRHPQNFSRLWRTGLQSFRISRPLKKALVNTSYGKLREPSQRNGQEININKTLLLVERSCVFRKLLTSKLNRDPSLVVLIERLTPLFEAIENGEIVPPLTNQCDGLFHIDDVNYGLGTDIFEAYANFQSALEDWASKGWFPQK